MGVSVNTTITLVDATPYRLRYFLQVSNDGTPGTATVLPNFTGGTTPNLDTDSIVPGTIMHGLVQLAVADQAGARHVLAGHDVPPGLPVAANLMRAHCKITPRLVQSGDITNWQVDVNEGAAAGSAPSTGRPVILIRFGAGAKNGDTGYLDIHIDHSYSQNG